MARAGDLDPYQNVTYPEHPGLPSRDTLKAPHLNIIRKEQESACVSCFRRFGFALPKKTNFIIHFGAPGNLLGTEKKPDR